MKYDWIKLEQEFLLSDYKSVSKFLKSKNIDNTSGSVKKATKGWSNKKAQKEHQKSTKIIEKVIEEKIKEEVEQKVKIDEVAQKLLDKINLATEELNKYINKTTKKTKKKFTVKDSTGTSIDNEIVEEKNSIEEVISLINKNGLKTLTSALKDLSDISKYKEKENSNSKEMPTININVVDNSKLEEDLWRDFNENN